MDAYDCIITRRSIRRYQDKPVSDEIIKKILTAAMMAPSAGDQRPWHFVVVKDRKVLEELSQVHTYHGMTKDAAFAVMVCADLAHERHPDFWVQDCSAAAQNILLAAHAFGLGAVWTGVHPRPDRQEAFKKILKIPKDIIPFALIPIGYPAEKRTVKDRYDGKLVHNGKW